VFNPHFDIPFRFTSSGGVALVEQNTFDDIANCVEVIVRTPLGFRDDAPEFGFPDLALLQQPIITKDLVDLVQAQEPRSVVLISERPDFFDNLIDRVTIQVG
jgi:phage baseplate assembly protein W